MATRHLVTPGNPNAQYLVPDPARSDPGDSKDYLAAPDLLPVMHALIAAHDELNFLAEHRILLLWKRKGGSNKGAPRMGKTQLITGLASHFTGDDEAVVWLAADHVGEAYLSRYQVEALLYHELCHFDEDEETRELLLKGHDFEGFRSEIERYGWWDEKTAAIADAVQLRLVEEPRPAQTRLVTGRSRRRVEANADGDDGASPRGTVDRITFSTNLPGDKPVTLTAETFARVDTIIADRRERGATVTPGA